MLRGLAVGWVDGLSHPHTESTSKFIGVHMSFSEISFEVRNRCFLLTNHISGRGLLTDI